jgi:hypothetical protein
MTSLPKAQNSNCPIYFSKHLLSRLSHPLCPAPGSMAQVPPGLAERSGLENFESGLTATSLELIGDTWSVALSDLDLVEVGHFVGTSTVVTVVKTGVGEAHGITPDLAHAWRGSITSHVGIGESSGGAVATDERSVRRCWSWCRGRRSRGGS